MRITEVAQSCGKSLASEIRRKFCGDNSLDFIRMASAWQIEHDFYINRDKLFVEKQVFEDVTFPYPELDEASACMWVRPPSLINAPVFLRDPSQPGVIHQGHMSCETFPVVLDILQRRPHLWNYVVAQDQSFDQDYAGMFMFRFWRSGKTLPVVVDDVLPFDVDSKIFMLSTVYNAPDIWCALMEKAYAKFLGGYDRLKTVSVYEAISDILGCSVQMYTISALDAKARLFKVLQSTFEFDNIAIAKLKISPKAASVFRTELVHCLYTVTSMKSVVEEDGNAQWILTLSQPWIKPGAISEDLAEDINMLSCTLKDFTQEFSELFVCISRFNKLFSIPNALSRHWETLAISGKWARCRQTDSELLSYPFARIGVNKPDTFGESRLCTVIVSLMQCYDLPMTEPYEVGMVVYGLRGVESLHRRVPTRKLALSDPVVKTDLNAFKEITVYMCLEPGQYLIVPETKEGCFCRARSRYLLTLYSVEPVKLLNGGAQQYGEEFMSPVTINVTACKYVPVGHPIRVTAKITDFPSQTRYTMSALLMFVRISSSYPHETVIKVRMEFLEVCQGLMDKELRMWVSFPEYVKFPLQGEEFLARCSVFIHELSIEVNALTVVTTVLPKVKMAVDKNVTTGKPSTLTAMLYNTLPLTIRSARFRVLCSMESDKIWITGSPYELPPFATMWIICRLQASVPTCHQVKVYFLSSAFKRSVSLNVQVKDSAGHMIDVCPTIVNRLLGQKDSIPSANEGPQMVSCCVKHNQVSVSRLHHANIKSCWYTINADPKPSEVPKEIPEEIFYSTLEMMRDVTPESELPADETENESIVMSKP